MKYLFSITGLTLFFASLGFLFLQYWGQSRPIKHYEHGFFSPPLEWVVNPQTSENIEKLKSHLRLSAFWIDVEKTPQDQLVWKGRPLEDLLNQHPDAKFILFINTNTSNIHNLTVRTLSNVEGNEKRLLIQSSYDVILSSIKELKPEWAYGVGSGTLTRFQVFSPYGLGSIVGYEGDLYITPPLWKGRWLLKKELLEELQRRKKPILVGPVKNNETFEKIKALGLNSFFTDDPEWFSHLPQQ